MSVRVVENKQAQTVHHKCDFPCLNTGAVITSK